jgi:expansin (peptidoglycan-binding protein)
MWRMTIAALEELGETGIMVSGENLTYLQIYGPNGKMSGYLSETWPSADSMRSDLMQNHGGGVPVDVIEKLVMASEVID